MSRREKDLTGLKYNKLTAIKKLHIHNGKWVWLWECECGNKKEIVGSEVTQGKIKSCGCGRIKHGDAKTSLYQTYHRIRKNCTIPSDPSYHKYGGRGIRLCEEWTEGGYLAFKSWAIDNGFQEGLLLRRINENENFEPSNCEWVESEDLVGMKFSRLTVVKNAGSNNHGKKQWLCECECGGFATVTTGSLKNGNTKSCGCLASDLTRKANTTHGKSNKRIYNIYNMMKRRCNNENGDDYKDYGQRGIKVCDEWLDRENGFMNFYSWAMLNGYEDCLSIDRKDVNGNYEPDNCRWVTNEVQANNKRSNFYIEINGEIKTIAQWSKESNISRTNIRRRYEKGIRGEDLLRPVEWGAEYKSNEKGVLWHKKSQKWAVGIVIDNKKVHIGMFVHLEDAIKAKYEYIKENNISHSL